jgi:hypothetical protein
MHDLLTALDFLIQGSRLPTLPSFQRRQSCAGKLLPLMPAHPEMKMMAALHKIDKNAEEGMRSTKICPVQ